MTTIEELTNDFEEVINLSHQHKEELLELSVHFLDKYSRRLRSTPQDTLSQTAMRVFETQIRSL